MYPDDIPGAKDIGFDFIITNTMKSELPDEVKNRVKDLVQKIRSRFNNLSIEVESVDIIDEPVIEFRSTKKGTVIKVCEVCCEEFETAWEERETCGCPEHRGNELYESVKGCWIQIEENTSDLGGVKVKSVEYLDERQDVYNGTVALYHNYFTVDENTGTIVNQLNCGE